MPRRRGLRPRLLAAVVRSKATLAFAAERQVVSRTRVVRTPAQLADAIEVVLLDAGRRPPCTSGEIAALERRLQIRVPEDVRGFYGQMDGTDGMTTVDHGLVTLWPLERWTRAKDETFGSDEEIADAIIIADHSISI